MSLWDRFLSNIKLASNPMSFSYKSFCDVLYSIDFQLKQFDCRLHQDKNNLLSTDFAIHDLMDDFDYLVPRWSQEYPRLMTSYTNRKMFA